MPTYRTGYKAVSGFIKIVVAFLFADWFSYSGCLFARTLVLIVLSGFSITTSGRAQVRVAPDQHLGFLFFASGSGFTGHQ